MLFRELLTPLAAACAESRNIIDSVLSVLNNMMQKYIFTVIKQFLNFQFSVFI